MLKKLRELKQKIAETSPFDLGENSECCQCKERYCSCLNRNSDGGWIKGDRYFSLEDVLVALREKDYFVEGVDEGLNGELTFEVFIRDQNYEKHPIESNSEVFLYWKSNTPLDEQSPDTIKFLEDILL